MAKIIFCKKSVADALKAEWSAQVQNEDITGNTFASSAMGMKIIEKPDEWFEHLKTKEGKQPNWVEIDDSKFKMQPTTMDSIIKEQADDIIKGETTLLSLTSQLINRLCNKKGDADGRKDTEDNNSKDNS